jgi:uncharacterized delta-60 repeat protein
MKRIVLFITVSLFFCVSCSDDSSTHTTSQIVGNLDPSFNYPDGFVLFADPYHNGEKGIETAIQSDGRIIVMGYTYDGARNRILLLGYNPDGKLDKTFGTEGYVIFHNGGIDEKGLGLALTGKGAIIVTGYIKFQSHRDILVLRCSPAGDLEKVFTYSSGGEHTDIGFGVAVQADGKIIVVGEQSGGDNQDISVLRLTSDLEPDSGFGNGGVVTYNGTGNENDKGFAVALQDDGKIVVVGAHIVKGQEKEDVLILRFRPDGVLDTDFADNGVFTYSHVGDYSDYGNFVALQPDGKIVAAGASYDGQSFKMLLLRLDVKGTLDMGFGTDGVAIYQRQPSVYDYAFGLAIQQDGKILVAGTSNNGSNDDAVVLRYDSHGVLDRGFAENGVFTFNGVADGEDRAHSIAIQPDRRIVVAGYSHSGEDDDVLTLRLR